MRKIKYTEQNNNNGEFYTKKSKTLVEDDGTIEKNFNSINYTKGKSANFHYETNEPKIVVPAFIIFTLVFLVIGIIVINLSLKSNNTFLLIWGIMWIVFLIIFVLDNLIKHGKSWYNELFKKNNDSK